MTIGIDVEVGDQIKVAFFTFLFQEVLISFIFPFNLYFYGTRLYIATIFHQFAQIWELEQFCLLFHWSFCWLPDRLFQYENCLSG